MHYVGGITLHVLPIGKCTVPHRYELDDVEFLDLNTFLNKHPTHGEDSSQRYNDEEYPV